MRLILFFSFLFFFSLSANAQQGCTDPQAINYNSQATQNDGSCQYATSNYEPQEIAEFTEILNENSGIIVVDTSLWVNVDAQAINKLFKVDSLTGTVQKELEIENGFNVDWEELAQDDQHIYIGDFGNNHGDRENLRIYKMDKEELEKDTAVVTVILFEYEDQSDYTRTAFNETNFDCEAFFYFNDSLHLFSKNWLNGKTRHYVLPTQEGMYTAKLVESFDTKGFITSADINEDGVVALLGYTEGGSTFLWLLHDYEGSQFFTGNKRRIELGSGIVNGKTEGISFSNGLRGYITSESFSQLIIQLPPKLLSFDLTQFFDESTSISQINLAKAEWQIFPNPFQKQLIVLAKAHNEKANFYLYDSAGRMIMESRQVNGLRWNTADLLAGFYLLRIEDREGKSQNLKLIKFH